MKPTGILVPARVRRPPRRSSLTTALLLLLSVLAANACIREPQYWSACDDPDPVCDSRCIAADRSPLYLWIGPSDDPPPCPRITHDEVFRAHADPIPGAMTCPECSCAESATTCSPSSDWTIVPRACDEAPRGGVYFGGPPGWNGVCYSQTPIAPDLECPGGEPCAQSMTVPAPAATGEPCAPVAAGDPTVEDPPWSWGTLALGCFDREHDYCDGGEYLILPEDIPRGFRLCVDARGATCPLDFSEEVTVYLDAEDARSCSPCTCGPPEGNACSLEVTAHSDGACVTEVGSAVVGSDGEGACFDLPDGTALGSKQAELVSATPGACVPGDSEPTGSVVPTSPVTFCCRPP